MTADTPTESGLRGLRILLVEDNYILASSLRRTLQAWGCEVVGPAPSVEEGERLAEHEYVSGGILDINIRGGSSAPIAQMLRRRGRPFLFITGYASPQELSDDLQGARRLLKPLNEAALYEAMLESFVDG